MSLPIIFCHYGNKPYLRYTLECARLSNPRKDIVLLGDESNRRVARRLGVRHLPFSGLAGSERLARFRASYQAVEGPEHAPLRGGVNWLQFVFERWYYIAEFLRVEGVGAFWHFDSDNMLFAALSEHEARFSDLDCTEQCDGICMNGYVSGLHVVEPYLDKINDIFTRKEFLEGERARLAREQPNFAFTEMNAYRVFRDEDGIRSARLSDMYEGALFDDCICEAHGMQTEMLSNGQYAKVVHLNPDGRFYCLRAGTHEIVWLNSLNLSWVPTATFPVVLAHFRRRLDVREDTLPRPAADDTVQRRLKAGEGARWLRRVWRRVRRPLGSG